MAEKIDKVTVRAGRLIKVANQNKHFLANPTYVSVWVEDANGDNERCLLFTDRELAAAERRAAKNPEDCPKKGLLQDLLD